MMTAMGDPLPSPPRDPADAPAAPTRPIRLSGKKKAD